MIDLPKTSRSSADTDGVLAGCRVLVVEDDYFIAEDLCDCLRMEGADIVGPTGTVDEALRLARQAERLDCASVDLNLAGKPVDEVARALRGRSIAFFFVTGYRAGGTAEEFASVPRLIKPFDRRQLIDLVRQLRGSQAWKGR